MRGARMPLVDNGEVIGATLCTQDGIKPVYVSIGHRVSLDTACAWVLKASTKYRLPETTRAADHAVKLAMKCTGQT
jgi:deoxyribonuclease V